MWPPPRFPKASFLRLRGAAFVVVLSAGALAAAFGVGLAECADVDPVSVLPGDGEVPGWVRDGEPATAYSLEELTELIDGAAFLYEQYGFVAAAFQNYLGEVSGEEAQMTLSAFNQGTAENAQALFHDPESGGGDPVGDWPGSGEARIEASPFGWIRFQFWEECFFISIYIDHGGDEAASAVRAMAEATLGLIQGASPAAQSTWSAIKELYKE